jgi:hypothetical protein
MTDQNCRALEPAEIGLGSRSLAAMVHQAILLDTDPDTIDGLLERVHHLEVRLIRYTESTGAPLKEIRSWLFALRRTLLLHRDRHRT